MSLVWIAGYGSGRQAAGQHETSGHVVWLSAWESMPLYEAMAEIKRAQELDPLSLIISIRRALFQPDQLNTGIK